MTAHSVVFVAWAMLLMGLSLGRKSSTHDGIKENGLMEERKGQKRVDVFSPRLRQVQDLVQNATGFNDTTVSDVYNYGCWCGPGGEGIDVDNFDYCCKVHDFCELDVFTDECGFQGGYVSFDKEFKHDGFQCSPLSEYTDTTNENEKKCRRANCLCDMEFVRCLGHFKAEFDPDNVGWVTTQQRSCAVPAPEGDLCKPKADVIVLIQDSGGISTATVGNIKTVVRRLLTTLGNETQDYNFALAIYATSRDMSCFGNAADTISYMDREYQHGQHGTQNLLKRALETMIVRQFNKRRDDRQGNDTVKILAMFTDGNAEEKDGRVVDTYELEQTAKVLRDDNNIRMAGALIPNTQNTQRIEQLKGIVSHPDDAIDVEFSPANLNNIADQLADRVKRLVCPVRYTVEIFTPETFVRTEYRFFISVKGQGELKTTYQLLTITGDEMQGNQFVIQGEFLDSVDVGTITEVEFLPDRIVQGNRRWTLNQIKVTKGEETVTAVFNQRIPVFPFIRLTAPATPSEPPSEE